MDKLTLLNYLQSRDRTLSNLTVNTRLAGSNAGVEEAVKERAVLAALADLVRNSDLPKFEKGVVGAPKVRLSDEAKERIANAPPLEAEGPPMEPDPDPEIVHAARTSQEGAEALAQNDPNLAPTPPAQFMEARKNVGGRPRRDGTPAQPRQTP